MSDPIGLEPRFSDDRHWYWNGGAWIPASEAPAPPPAPTTPPPPPRQSRPHPHPFPNPRSQPLRNPHRSLYPGHVRKCCQLACSKRLTVSLGPPPVTTT